MSLGKDLASIRKSQNLTLEDIQNATKIPLGTLKSIEDGRIFSEFDENTTYIRSFIRSYAKVLKIDDDDIIQALDEQEAGTYSGSLLTDSETLPADDTFEAQDDDVTEDEYPQPTAPPQKNRPEKPVNKSSEKTPSAKSGGIDWANLGHRYNPAKKSSRTWMLVVVLILLAGLSAAGVYFYGDTLWGDNETTAEEMATETPEENPPLTEADTLQAGENTPEPVAENDAQETVNENTTEDNGLITLGDTLTVSVYAAYGQLEPVRITSDFNEQTNPFWMEQGVAHLFDFRDTLLVRGQYSRLLLLFNGHVIENPRQNYFSPENDAIMITRSILDQEPYLSPAPDEFPLEVGPPDSVSYRIRF